MRVVISPKHLGISHKLAKEMNRLAKKFDRKTYSKVEDVDSLLLKRDISVEKKKRILIRKLHSLITKAFAINKEKVTKNAFNSLASRLLGVRNIVLKLRSINQYLETMFLDDLSVLNIKVGSQGRKLNSKNGLIKDEFEALEYTAYKLIEEVVMLDKKLLAEYKSRGEKMLATEKAGIKDLSSILGKESQVLEHLEAKLPPPRHLPAALMGEPLFTQWVSRVLALLSYFEHLYGKEIKIFSELKKSKSAKARINKKIMQLARERSKLLDIMEEKSISMSKFRLDGELKREVRKLTTTIGL